MPYIHGRNSALAIWDTSGASQLVQGDLTSFTFSWTRDNPETTTMGKDTKQRIAGVRDAKLSLAGIYSSSAANVLDTVIKAHMAASSNALVNVYPAGVTSGCAFYTACFLVSEHSLQTSVTAAVSVTTALDVSSGSISASVV